MEIDVLVGYECSQIMLKAFRQRGLKAYSCDIQNSYGKYPEYHLQGDFMTVINEVKPKLTIIHPPCDALTFTGNRWYANGKPKYSERVQAIAYTLNVWKKCLEVSRFVIMENPRGVLYSQPDLPRPQLIHPWQFGHKEKKATCLWLHNLPHLLPTQIEIVRNQTCYKMGESSFRKKLRSQTFEGIARAIAHQYSIFIK